MTVNTVLVTMQADNSPADVANAEGNIVAVPSGTMWPDSSNNPIVPAVVHGYLGDGQNGAGAGETILKLVASDNYSAGVLTWDFIINIRDFPTINQEQVAVNFASGATQSIWAILQAAGWTPPSVP